MNVVTDSLSRKPTLSAMEVPMDWKVQLSLEYSRNQFSCELIDATIRDGNYKVVDGIIYYRHRIYLVPRSDLRKNILEVAHDSPLAGHPAYLKSN